VRTTDPARPAPAASRRPVETRLPWCLTSAAGPKPAFSITRWPALRRQVSRRHNRRPSCTGDRLAGAAEADGDTCVAQAGRRTPRRPSRAVPSLGKTRPSARGWRSRNARDAPQQRQHVAGGEASRRSAGASGPRPAGSAEQLAGPLVVLRIQFVRDVHYARRRRFSSFVPEAVVLLPQQRDACAHSGARHAATIPAAPPPTTRTCGSSGVLEVVAERRHCCDIFLVCVQRIVPVPVRRVWNAAWNRHEASRRP